MNSSISIAVIGAGFSGSLVAARLLREGPAGLHVTLIERGDRLGRGIAYGTPDPAHLLNVPAGKMSAFPETPEHFLDWLRAAGERPEAGPGDFVPRQIYGHYVASVLEGAIAARPGAFTRVHDEVVGLAAAPAGLQISLASGGGQVFDRAVLAIGHFPPGHPGGLAQDLITSPRYIADPWDPAAFVGLDDTAEVLLIGAGLTAIDLALGWGAKAPGGRVHLLSRSGRLPRPHQASAPWPPFPAPGEEPDTARALVRLVRDQIATAAAQGVDWRGVIDALRPRTSALWQALPAAERRRLLRHARSFWEPHRHRLPPEVAGRVEARLGEGSWQLHAGRLKAIADTGEAVTVTLRDRKGGETHLTVARVINCTGPEADMRRMRHPLVASLLASGLVRPDALGLGLDVAADGALVDAAGVPSTRLYTLGPLRKGGLWETTAVPELRAQAAALVSRLLK